MSLAARLSEPVEVPRSRCSVNTLLESLSKKDREAVEAALADKRFTGTEISRALQAEGHHMPPNTLRRHRNRECCCAAQ